MEVDNESIIRVRHPVFLVIIPERIRDVNRGGGGRAGRVNAREAVGSRQ